jgi:hypothetical protein
MLDCDWSSDVCSSDLAIHAGPGFLPNPAPSAGGSFDRSRIVHCAVGIKAESWGNPPSSAVVAVELTNCVVDSSTTDGIRYLASGKSCSVGVHLRSCRIVDNGQHGVTGGAGGVGAVFSTFDARDTLIAGNGDCGVVGSCGDYCSGASWLRNCTIANNANAGLRALQWHALFVYNSNLAFNGEDVDSLGNQPTASWSNSEDGDLRGSPHCLDVDPQFVDSAIGDYRLKWGSPLIEAGDPTTTPGSLDLAGNARPIDGNLDAVARFDIGAFEFAPLYSPGDPAVGSDLTLELWGEDGNTTTVYFMRKPLVAPQTTPFGELVLDPNVMGIFRVMPVGSGPPTLVHRKIPSVPALVGRTFSFQALTHSSVAPQGLAYTNGVQVTMLP